MKSTSRRPGRHAHLPSHFLEPLEDRRLLAAVLVKDINLAGGDSSPRGLVEYRDHLYFVAQDLEHGLGLWRAPVGDSNAGAELVAAPLGENALALPLAVVNDRLIIEGPYGLFASDGTAAGTTSIGQSLSVDERVTPVAINGELYFNGRGVGTGRELWKTDGTPEGTVLVKDINPGSAESRPAELTVVGGTLFFSADDGVNGAELWKSDGTEAGTVLVKDVRPGASGSGPHELAAAGNVVLLSANDGVAGIELWRSDGSEAGTVLLEDVFPGETSSDPAELTSVNGSVFFSARAPGGGVDRLWKSDGVTTINLGSGTPGFITRVGDRVFFQGELSGGQGLWVSDGTPDGTRMIPNSRGITTEYLADVDGLMYGIINDSVSRALWRSDGTEAGTQLLSRFVGTPGVPVEAGGFAFFPANDVTHGTELWRSDGTTEGTSLVHDIHVGTSSSSPGGFPANGAGFFRYGGVAYFPAAPEDGRTFSTWETDGTAAGTIPAPHIGDPLGVFGDKLVMFRNDTQYGGELWLSDGSAAGTSVLKDTLPGPATGVADGFAAALAVGNGRMYFQGKRSVSTGWNLWTSDGTTDGTTKLRDFTSFPAHRNMVMLGDTLLFVAGDRLWLSDGTPDGTRPVSGTANSPAGPGVYGGFEMLDGVAYFVGATSGLDLELWRTDGTDSGTFRVKDVNLGTNGSMTSSSSELMQAVGGRLFFIANDGTHGQELWVSDGTDAGTRLVKDVNPGSAGTTYFSGTAFGALGDLAFYKLNDGVHSEELWRSDGTEAGTFMLKDITVGPSGINHLTEVNGTLYFTNFIDIWRTDGTVENTVQVTRNGSGPEIFRPEHLTEWKGGLLFAAQSAATGIELWKIAAPTADAGTAYFVELDGVVELDGTGSSDPDPNETLSYAWDLDGDGVFGEFEEDALRGMELGPTPEFNAAGLAAGTYPVTLRVTNGAGLSDEATADVVVQEEDESGVKTIVGDETEDDQWSVRAEFGEVQVYRRAFFGGFILQDSWPASEVRELRFLGDGGDDQVWVADEVRAAITFDGGDGSDTLLLTADNDAVSGTALERLEVYQGARAVLVKDIDLDVLDLGEDGHLDLKDGAGLTARTKQLLLDAASGSTLDLDDGRLVVENGDVAAIEALVALSRNAPGGRWTGPGITSTPAVDQPLRGVIVFRPADSTDLVVTGSWNGDVNGDGRINSDDYFRIDSGFLAQPATPTYSQGDFNFDDRINSDDYFLIDSAFLGQGAPLGVSVAESPLTVAAVASVNDESDEHERARAKRVVRAREAGVWERTVRGSGRAR